jgi:parallel beta-helix repeat protein
MKDTFSGFKSLTIILLATLLLGVLMSNGITHSKNPASLAEYQDVTHHEFNGILPTPTGRTATYVIAASDAPAHVKAQADVTVSTSVSTLINAAIVLGYKDICLSEGNSAASFPVTTTINLTSFTKLHGAGVGATVLTLAADIDMFTIGTGAVSAMNVELSGMNLAGGSRGYANTSDAIVISSVGGAADYTNQLLLANLRITDFKGKALYGEYFQDSVFRDISIGDCGSAGISTVKLVGNATVEVSSNIFYGLRIDGGEIAVEANNYCRMNRFIAPKWDTVGSTPCVYGYFIEGKENIIDGLIIGVPTGAAYDSVIGVQFNDNGGLDCKDNELTNSIISFNNHVTTVGVLTNSPHGNKIINNTIYGANHGIRVSGNADTILGNTLYSNDVDFAIFSSGALIQSNRFTGVYNAPGTITNFIDNIGYIAPGEIRTASGSLAGVTPAGIMASIDNPFGQAVRVLSVDIEVTTQGAASGSMCVGIGSSATTDYATMFSVLPCDNGTSYPYFFNSTKTATYGVQTDAINWETGSGNRYLNFFAHVANPAYVATYTITVMGN